MNESCIASVFLRDEDVPEQRFHDYEELLAYILDNETELDYIKWY